MKAQARFMRGAIWLGFALAMAFFQLPATADDGCYVEPYAQYLSFLASQGRSGPADLTNRTLVAGSHDTFSVSYTLANAGPDVTQVYLALWRVVDDPWDRHFVSEDSLSLAPSVAVAAPLAFSGLQRGETYVVALSVATSMPSIVSGQAQPDEVVRLKTSYIAWPAGQDLRLSVEDLYDPGQQQKMARLAIEGAPGNSYMFICSLPRNIDHLN